MTGNDTEIQWYIAREGQQHGPITDAEMKLFVDSGHLRATDLIWRPGFAEWRPAPLVFPQQPAAPLQPAPRATEPTQPRPAPQPSATAAAAPAAMEPRTQPGPAVTTAGRAAAPSAAAGAAARPASGAPAGQTSPGSGPSAAPSGSPQPTSRTTTKGNQPIAMDRGGGAAPAKLALKVALAAGLLGLAAGAGIYELKKRGTLLGADTSQDIPVVRAKADAPVAAKPVAARAVAPPAATPGTGSVAAPEAVAMTTPAPAATEPATAPALKPGEREAEALDRRYQQSRLWAYMKREQPAWYGAALAEAGRMVAEAKSERDATRHMVESLVALRRRNADVTLSADMARLKAIANAFLDNLQALADKDATTCYGFISQGEASPQIIDILHTANGNAPIEAQTIAIFDAMAEGRRSPTNHDKPKKEDYDLLATQLGKLGWSQADLQMFADPNQLSRAEPLRVCHMVRDWFKAHITISDQAVQERLLYETLRPVVAG